MGATALLLSIWTWEAAKHLLVLALLGTALAEVCLHGMQKLPFTCSYLLAKIELQYIAPAVRDYLLGDREGGGAAVFESLWHKADSLFHKINLSPFTPL